MQLNNFTSNSRALLLYRRGRAAMSPSLTLGLALFALTPYQATFAQDDYLLGEMIVDKTYDGMEISPKAKVELTEFVMQDLAFTVFSWKAPSTDQNRLTVWLNATEGRLKKLKLIADGAKLDPLVGNSIDQVLGITTAYNQYLGTLRSYKYSDTVVKVEGERTPGSIASRLAGSFSSNWLAAGGPAGHIAAITMGIAAGSGEAFMIGGESLERESKLSKLADIHKKWVDTLIRHTDDDFKRRVGYLKDAAAKLAEQHSEIKVPSFERTTGIEKINLDYANSPFPHVEKAYQLVNTDHVAAARAFAEAAEAVPQSVGLFPDIYTQSYKAPYLFLAGHLLEFESRIRGDSKLTLAQEAVLQFKAAMRTLGGGLSSVSYPYLIAYTRALAVSGQNNHAQEVARYISTNMPSDSLIKAAVSYDLATIYSLLGDQGAALRYLRDSYRAKPRRDPQALKDPLLAGLVNKNRSEVEMIAHNPLVGAWKLVTARDNETKYYFYVDGSFLKRKAAGIFPVIAIVNEVTGRWTVGEDSVLRLSDRKGIPDSESKFSIEGNFLTVKSADNVFKLKRISPAGILDQDHGVASLSDRKLYPDGRWDWSDGSKPLFARFTTTRMPSEPDHLYWYTYEDPLAGRVDQQLAQERTK